MGTHHRKRKRAGSLLGCGHQAPEDKTGQPSSRSMSCASCLWKIMAPPQARTSTKLAHGLSRRALAPIESQRQSPSLELDAGPGTQSPHATPRAGNSAAPVTSSTLCHTPAFLPAVAAPDARHRVCLASLSPVLRGRDSNVTLLGTSHIRGMQ